MVDRTREDDDFIALCVDPDQLGDVRHELLEQLIAELPRRQANVREAI